MKPRGSGAHSPRAEDWEVAEPLVPHLTVFEPDDDEYTGLVNARGEPFVRKKQRIGFDLSRRALSEK